MAKPMLVTLPFVLLLLDYWPLQRLGRKNPALQIRTEVSQQGAESRNVKILSVKKRKGKSGKKLKMQAMVKEEEPVAHRYHWAVVRPLLREKFPLFALRRSHDRNIRRPAKRRGGKIY